MSTLVVIFVIAVKVDVITIIALGAIDSIVAPFICAIGVSQRHNIDVEIVHQIDDTAVGAGA